MAETFKVPSIDYTSRDYESIRDDMISLIPFYTSEWTDHNPSDLGIVLLELMAYAGDVLHYYADRMVGESFLSTAITSNSVLRHALMLDYSPKGSSAATVNLQFIVPTSSTASADYTIPKGTKVSTGAIPFETDEDLLIPVGQTIGSVNATQGQTIAGAAPNGESIGTGTGKSSQRFLLAKRPVITSSIAVFIDETNSGAFTEWSPTHTFLNKLPTDRVYRLTVRQNGFVQVSFGDGVNGKSPPADAPIQVSYRIGGGDIGNVGSGVIDTIESTLPQGVTAVVSNILAAENGDDGQSITEVRDLAPLSLKTIDRAVSLQDYRDLAALQENVASAAARWDPTSQKVQVSLAASTGTVSALRQEEVRKFLDKRDGVGLGLEMVAPVFVPVNITGNVTIKDGYSRASVLSLINAEIDSYFIVGSAEEKASFDRDVFESDIIALIDNVEGVSYVDLARLSRTPTTDFSSWNSKTGTTVSVSVNSSNTVEQTLTITLPKDVMTPGVNQSFTVNGSVSGLETNVGIAQWGATSPTAFLLKTTSSLFGTADVDISVDLPSAVSINAGSALSPNPGDLLTIKVGKFRGNQTLSELEIRSKGTVALTMLGGNA